MFRTFYGDAVKAAWKKWRGWPWLVPSLYFLLLIVMAWRHEPWRDEAQAWIIVRDAGSLKAILSRMAYEGTPGLWHLLLYPLVRCGLPIFSMQVLHALLAFAAIALLVRHAPFPWYLKILLPFGHHPFYQYGVIARSYVLVGLFLFMLAAMHRSRFQRAWVYGLLLAMLANTSMHGAVLSAAIGSRFFLEYVLEHGGWRNRGFYVAGGLAAAGFLAAFVQVRPPPDLGVWWGWNLELGRRTVEIAVHALQGAFWPTFLVDRVGLRATMVVAVLFATLAGLWGRPRALGTWLAGFLMIWTLFQLKHPGDIWHHGLIYMFFIYSAWTGMADEAAGSSAWKRRVLPAALVVLAALQLVGGWRMAHADFFYPYSGGRETARFLREQGLDDRSTLIATAISYVGTSVLPYLPDTQRRFFAAETGEYYSFMKWDRRWSDNQGKPLPKMIQAMLAEMRRGGYRRLVFIAPFHVRDPEFLRWFPLRHVAPAGPVIRGDERLFVYEFRSPAGADERPHSSRPPEG